MVSKTLRIDELKKIVIKNMKKLDKNKYANQFMRQTEPPQTVFKSVKVSEKAKAEGNKLYERKDLNYTQLYEILILFNRSIAWAPKDSEQLAAGYANKSAVLLRMRKYKECITEIDKALKITDSVTLRIKMYCRKAECLTALGSADNRSFLEKAKFLLAKLDDSKKEIQALEKIIEKTQRTIDDDKLDIPKEEKRKTYALKMLEDVEKRDLSESIGVEYSKVYGKHLVAARDFEPGEIILSEKPYFNHLNDLRAHNYCDNCFYHLWTAVPCDHCPRRLYCSEQCKSDAWNNHHEIDCFALINIVKVFLESKLNGRVPFVISVFCKALKEAGSIEQLLIDSELSNQYRGEIASASSQVHKFTICKIFYSWMKDLRNIEIRMRYIVKST